MARGLTIDELYDMILTCNEYIEADLSSDKKVFLTIPTLGKVKVKWSYTADERLENLEESLNTLENIYLALDDYPAYIERCDKRECGN